MKMTEQIKPKIKYYVLIFGIWWRISEKNFYSGKWYKYFTKIEKGK